MKRLTLVLLLILPAGCISMNAATDISGVWLIKQDRSFDGKGAVPGNTARPFDEWRAAAVCGH